MLAKLSNKQLKFHIFIPCECDVKHRGMFAHALSMDNHNHVDASVVIHNGVRHQFRAIVKLIIDFDTDNLCHQKKSVSKQQQIIDKNVAFNEIT